MRVRLHRIPEEDNDIHFSLGNERPELLVAAEGPGFQFDDRVFELPPVAQLFQQGFLDEFPRCSRAGELMVENDLSVPPRPFHEVFLTVIVGNEGNSFRMAHGLHSIL